MKTDTTARDRADYLGAQNAAAERGARTHAGNQTPGFRILHV